MLLMPIQKDLGRKTAKGLNASCHTQKRTIGPTRPKTVPLPPPLLEIGTQILTRLHLAFVVMGNSPPQKVVGEALSALRGGPDQKVLMLKLLSIETTIT